MGGTRTVRLASTNLSVAAPRCPRCAATGMHMWNGQICLAGEHAVRKRCATSLVQGSYGWHNLHRHHRPRQERP